MEELSQVFTHTSKIIIGRIPKISFGQVNHYLIISNLNRDNGFLRYWTASNIPLFLLAAPMITIMAVSAKWAFQTRPTAFVTGASKGTNVDAAVTDEQTKQLSNEADDLLRRITIPQLVLVLYTFTNAHVQIITRLSSAYPVWVWFVAKEVVTANSKRQASYLIRYMVMYAIVQGGLFSSFLPPA